MVSSVFFTLGNGKFDIILYVLPLWKTLLIGMSFPNKGTMTCVILCSVSWNYFSLIVILINGSVIEEHEIHAVVLLTEVPLTFGAAVTKLHFP